MNVMLSTTSRNKVFHLPGCPYENRIRYHNREEVRRDQAVHMGYRPCKYCSTIQAYYRIRQPFIKLMTRNYGTQFTLSKYTDTLYIRTDVGFWKMYTKADMQYRLYHLNVFDQTLSTEQMMHGKYHHQSDVKLSASPNSIIQYIVKHDEAKKIIADDYRKLPQKTRREKKYYEIARKRDHRQKRRQLYNLLDCISRGETPANKWVAIC